MLVNSDGEDLKAIVPDPGQTPLLCIEFYRTSPHSLVLPITRFP